MHRLLTQWDTSDLRSLFMSRLARGDSGAVIGFYQRRERDVVTMEQHRFIERGFRYGSRLLERGVEPGDRVVIVAPTPEVILTAYLACVYVGALPTIHPARPAFDDRDRFRTGLTAAVDAIGTPVWFIAEADGDTPKMPVPPSDNVIPFDLDDPSNYVVGASVGPSVVNAHDLVHLQMTSGSTGMPKAVGVTHNSTLANISAMADRLDLVEEDVLGSWLPLYHDMGLIGFALMPLTLGIDIHIMSPFDFLAKPAEWLRLIDDRNISFACFPNFGYEYMLRRTKPSQLEGLDLSRMRRSYSGAEPVSATIMRQFADRFSPYGLDPAVLKATYGMAETALMATMPEVDQPLKYLVVEGSNFGYDDEIVVLEEGTIHTIDVDSLPQAGTPIVSVGVPAEGLEVWLVDAEGRHIASPLRSGEVIVRGTSVTAGYLDDGGIPSPFTGGEFATGDVGFMYDGELYIVDRLKNTIIRNGQNYSAYVLESELAEAAGIGVGQILVIDSNLRDNGKVVAVVEADRKIDTAETRARILDNLDRFDLPLEELVIVKPGSLPQTTSGKKQHAKVRKMLHDDELSVLERHTLTVPTSDDQADDVDIDLTVVDVEHKVLATVERIARDRGIAGTIRSDARFVHDLAFDSLAMYEMGMELERRFDIAIPESELGGLKTIEDTCDLVQTLIARQAKAQGTNKTQRSLAETVESMHDVPQAYRTAKAQRGRQVLIDGKWVTDFASCNYLGLDLHDDVVRSIPSALDQWGVHPSWTRAVASPAPYRRLEGALADLVGTADTVVFPTVTLLHMGVLPRLAGPGGAIVVDQAAHASIQEACELAGSRGTRVITSPHDDLDALARHLERLDDATTRIIALDGVYSMEGSYPDLARYVELAERYDARLYVDDAHGFGVIGENPDAQMPFGYRGSGVVRYSGLGYDRITYVGGMSKAFSSMAAFVTCNSAEERRDLEQASTMIFSGPIPVASLASALAGLQVNDNEGDLIRDRLWQNTSRLIDGVRDLGFHVDNTAGFPIVNVVLGSVDLVHRGCEIMWDHNILLTPSLFPAVPLHRGGMRFSVTASNTLAEVDQALAGLEEVRRTIGVGDSDTAGSVDSKGWSATTTT